MRAPGEVVLIIGFPAAGKTTEVAEYKKTHVRLNRDELGGTLKGLAYRLKEQIKKGKTNFVLDNTFGTAKLRAPVIAVAKEFNIPVRCIWIQTSIEDSKFNAATRMVRKYGYLLTNEQIKEKGKKDSGCFPISVLFSYRKRFEKPALDEGFSEIKKVKFVRRPNDYTNKALILDYDGTLRHTKSGNKYPLDSEDISIYPNRKKVLQQYIDNGYLLLGVSNQSGVGKGILSKKTAIECFKKTNELLGFDIDFRFCPHNTFPVSCFCRKPQIGIGVELIEKYKLDPTQCFYIGDLTTDKTFAKNCQFNYYHPDDFFK